MGIRSQATLVTFQTVRKSGFNVKLICRRITPWQFWMGPFLISLMQCINNRKNDNKSSRTQWLWKKMLLLYELGSAYYHWPPRRQATGYMGSIKPIFVYSFFKGAGFDELVELFFSLFIVRQNKVGWICQKAPRGFEWDFFNHSVMTSGEENKWLNKWNLNTLEKKVN